MKKISILYNHIISLENLLSAWEEFLSGKKQKRDVQEFGLRLMDNVFALQRDLLNRRYTHGSYQAFNICDPKPRNIHKAQVRDRLLHHGVYRILYPEFDKIFIADSYSCRLGRGTHRAIKRFESFGRKVSKNSTRTSWLLKCDIRKFFASIDHAVLLRILEERIEDKDIVYLLKRIVKSFHSFQEGVGLPLGNLTSQLLVNIYMNEFDRFVKHRLKIKYYIRYADDFVIFDTDRDKLLELTPKIANFLEEELKLSLHPDKVFVKTLSSGVDFLGWVHFPDHRVLRTATKRRALKALKESENINKLGSYAGLLGHGNQFLLREEFLKKAENLLKTKQK